MVFSKNKILDELGFYADQDGILDRMWRENGGWDDHLNNTKRYILSFADKITDRSKAYVLGSGWLLDVPVKELSEGFSEVFLCDVVHPKEIKEKIKRYKNVTCLEKDLTGGYIRAVYELACRIRKEGKQPLGGLHVPANDFYADGFVASVNILNQLDIILTDYLIQFGLYTTDEIRAFKKRVQMGHISSLPVNKTCLIADYEELIYDDTGKAESRSLVWATLPEGKNVERWQWNFDTCKTYYEGKKTILNVVAMEL